MRPVAICATKDASARQLVRKPSEESKPAILDKMNVGSEAQLFGVCKAGAAHTYSSAFRPLHQDRNVAGQLFPVAPAKDAKADGWAVSVQQNHWNMTTTVTVYPHWRVHHLKKLIQVLTGVPCEQHNLNFAGYCLNDHMHISSSGMFDGCTVKVLLKLTVNSMPAPQPDPLMKLWIKLMRGTRLELWAKPAQTVHQLKQFIEQVMGAAPDCQILIFAGQPLESAFSLRDYGLKSGASVHPARHLNYAT
ncbi:hypothetical protein MMC08_005591 [Hypocenomyce scalaris]|nr:hypothetical protein [Hypocenomyce scalaris]